MKVTDRLISELKASEYNPRKISDKALEDLKKSLETFTAVEPIVINSNPQRKDIVIGGHQRLKAAQLLGWKKMPCIAVDLPLDKERELNIRLNKNAGEWDWDKLLEFEVADLITFGFEEGELGTGPDFEPVGSESQGKLDELQPKLIKCPKCGETVDIRHCSAKS